ncbi:MAG: succinylglutamate desuccinylase/aspartoacylase family protein [bacterium]
MIITKGTGTIKVTIVCCLHGDEIFGKKFFDYYTSKIDKYPELKLILANTKALKQKTRYIEEDLNRCFPGNSTGNYEERLASRMINAIGNPEYLIDIHTTTSDTLTTPIITNIDIKTKQILNLTDFGTIIYMVKEMAKHSLIGQYEIGVSFETGIKYSKTPESFQEIKAVIEGLLSGKKQTPISRTILKVSETISNDVILPINAKNLELIEELGFYPFLIGEDTYTEFQGFAGRYHKTELI